MRTFRAHLHTDFIGFSENYQLSLSESHHLSKVLRLKEGDEIEVFDGKGHRYAATIENVGKTVSIRILEEKPSDTKSPLALHLMISVGKGDKMDWVVQKATELGVAKITPLISSRCEVRLSQERMHKKIEHWREIALQACVQSGQDTLPEISQASDFFSALKTLTSENRILLHPSSDHEGRLKNILGKLSSATELSFLVGPEGGFDQKEVRHARENHFRLASLGPRILRMETAAIASLALAQGFIGDL